MKRKLYDLCEQFKAAEQSFRSAAAAFRGLAEQIRLADPKGKWRTRHNP
jgi:hypothetical protein